MSTEVYDVIVHGNTVGATFASCAAADEGSRVGQIFEQVGLGGILAQGLSATDLGRYGRFGIGYLSRELLDRMGTDMGSTDDIIRTNPHLVQLTCRQMLESRRVIVRSQKTIASHTDGGTPTLTSITDTDGNIYQAAAWVEASEIGNLASRKCTMRRGREASSDFNEPLNGFYPVESTFTPFACYDSFGALIYGFKPYPAMSPGDRDLGVMAYGQRYCLTQNKFNRVKWIKPAGYDESKILYLIRAGNHLNPAWIPFGVAACLDGKGDMNSDFGIPLQWDYPDGNDAARASIDQQIWTEQASWHWWLANDPSVDPAVRRYARSWGPAKNEFQFIGNTASSYPKEPYIRNANRLDGIKVMTSHDLQDDPIKTTKLAKGFYSMDCHVVQRLAVIRNGVSGYLLDTLGADPDISIRQVTPGYDIPFEAGRPLMSEWDNGLVGIPMSATFAAMASLRIDIQKANFCTGLGRIASKKARLGTSFDAIDIAAVQAELRALGQVLDFTAP